MVWAPARVSHTQKRDMPKPPLAILDPSGPALPLPLAGWGGGEGAAPPLETAPPLPTRATPPPVCCSQCNRRAEEKLCPSHEIAVVEGARRSFSVKKTSAVLIQLPANKQTNKQTSCLYCWPSPADVSQKLVRAKKKSRRGPRKKLRGNAVGTWANANKGYIVALRCWKAFCC